jgi:hypothetical protein
MNKISKQRYKVFCGRTPFRNFSFRMMQECSGTFFADVGVTNTTLSGQILGHSLPFPKEK